jgi:aspartyl-tRNA(Asn)/glutamyl-tRNA(Gln) amidotransferase subunit B
MRSKEETHDYRYFPEPDLVPVAVDEGWLNRIRGEMPELPRPRRDRFMEALGLPRYDADVLTAERPVAEYFEKTLAGLVKIAGGGAREHAKPVSNWVMTEILRLASERKASVADSPVTPENLAALIGLIKEGTISGKIAKDVFEEMASTGAEPRRIVEQRGMLQLSDEREIGEIVDRVLEEKPAQAAMVLSGNSKVFGFFVGEVMKRTQGRANPRVVNDTLRKRFAALKG